MMSRIGILMLACMGLFAGLLQAQRAVRVKLATLAPTGSSYYKTLQAMGQKWRSAPGGGARLVIYPDGRMGGESAVVDKMQVGQLHAGMLTVKGLSDIVPDVRALQNMPMMFRSLEELDYVRKQLQPEFEKKFAEKGYVVLFWGDAGWVRFFTREKVVRPDELKKFKIFTWVGDSGQVEVMKAAGYRPVALETEDILIQLRTGGVDAVPTVPFYALAGQFYVPAPHMLELNWAPLVGGAVITKKIWDRFPPEAQREMMAAAREAGEAVQKRSRAEGDEAVAAMRKRGLTVHTVNNAVKAEWRKFAEQLYPKIRGALVPAKMFDRVQKLVEDYRASQ